MMYGCSAAAAAAAAGSLLSQKARDLTEAGRQRGESNMLDLLARSRLAIKGYARNTTQVYDSLNKRLQAVILRDWVRRRGRGTFAKRWHPFVIVRPGGPEFHNLPSVRDGSVL